MSEHSQLHQLPVFVQVQEIPPGGIPEMFAGPLAEGHNNRQRSWLDEIKDMGIMAAPVYSLANPDVCGGHI